MPETTTPAPVETTTPAASPTGLPMLPVWLAPWLAGIVGLAAVLVSVLPPHTIGFKVATAIVGFGGALGIASPGVRKPTA